MKNTGNPLCLEEQQFISSNRPSRSARFTKYSFTSMRLCRIVSLSLVLWTTLPQILRSKNTALECKAFAWTAPTALTTQAERQISFTNERYRQNRIKETSLNDFSSKSALQQVEALKNRIEAEELLGKEDEQIKPDGANGMFKSKIKIGSVVPQAKGLPVNKQQLEAALANLEDDMQLLDNLAGEANQLSALELGVLTSAVLTAASSPVVLGGRLTGFLAPAAAAFSAAIGLGAEYRGKVAVADGKEVAAVSIQCAAEAEALLANAERAKAITPLCVGVGATAATFALLVPVLLDIVGISNLQVMTEIYLCCPLLSILSAAVSSLALQETTSFAQRAIGIGNRRFARSGIVGQTWLSSTEQIDLKSKTSSSKWRSFSAAVLPAPLIGALVPGALPTKTIVVAALAAAESAYFLARSEAVLSRATDAVALKARSAAVCDTYANQGARSAAILPFTSALSAFCAASTAAIVEFPYVKSLAVAGTAPGLASQVLIVSFFPVLSSVLSGAASLSKARCEVDAEAAKQAACTLSSAYQDESDDPFLKPFRGVQELVRLTLRNSIWEPFKQLWRRTNVRFWFRRRDTSRREITDENSDAAVDEREANSMVATPVPST